MAESIMFRNPILPHPGHQAFSPVLSKIFSIVISYNL